jgi:cold shock CspA family protein
MIGVIKMIKEDKGFGFIALEGRDKDLFFHATGVVAGVSFKDMRVGDKVTVADIESTDRGDSAIGVDLA